MLLLSLGAVLLLAGVGLATQEISQFKIGDDLFIAGDNVTVDEDVVGDLYVAGNNVRVKANVAGDVMFGGNSVTIDGNVGGALRGGGQQINVNGSVERLILIGGMNVNLNAGENATANNVMVGGQTVSIDRPIAGDLAAGASVLDIEKEVAGNAKLSVEDETSINEDMIKGEITYVMHSGYQTPKGWAVASYGGTILSTIYLTLTVVLFGMIVYLFFPTATTELVMVQRKQPWLVAIFGILAVPLALAAGFLFLISGALAMLALVFAMLAPALFVLGIASVYQNLGQLLTKARGERRGWAIMIGGIAFVVLYLIPVVNVFVGIIAAILGSGSIIVVLLQRVKALPKLT